MSPNKTFIISIAGPSCAGKTETAKAVARLLNARILGLDSYYLDLGHVEFEQRTRFNFDEPASIDHELLIRQLRDFTAGKFIEAPVYDFVRHTRSDRTETIHPAPFLVLEGLFVLYWDDVRTISDLTVYVDAPDDICLARRQYRDVRERGRTVECVLSQYNETVRPMAAKYVWPTKELAEMVVSGTDTLDHCAAQVIAAINRKTTHSAARIVASAI